MSQADISTMNSDFRNVLYLYNSTQTYTATVFEHISALKKYSKHCTFFAHQDQYANLAIDFANFDAIIIHYTVRLPFDQIADGTAAAISEYKGLKVLFIQDEYDHTHRAWHWIKRLGIQLVFTVVPSTGISRVYPSHELPGVRFVSVLTGYVPEKLPSLPLIQTSQRPLIVGYRGRPLPIRYGQLGLDKIGIGELVAGFCLRQNIAHDIAWTEEARIYGPKWYEFMSSCRAVLGTESGSNVFDWDGTLAANIQSFRNNSPRTTDSDVYAALIQPLEISGLMNQISPRIFEAIALHTVLVLFEGSYSEVILPGVHFIPLKRDGSNLEDVFKLLADETYVDAMTERAYQDIIGSGRYSYNSFVQLVDREIWVSHTEIRPTSMEESADCSGNSSSSGPSALTTSPVQALPPPPLPSRRRRIVTRLGRMLLGPMKAVMSRILRFL